MTWSRSARAVLAFSVVGAMTLGVSAPCAAREPTPTAAELAQARDLFSKAERDERAHDWSAALEKLNRAGAIKMTPGIRFHIALCHENTGALLEALADYEAAALQAVAENVTEVADAVREPLSDLRSRVPSLTLTIVNAPAQGVVVTIDDHELTAAQLASPIRLMPGTHRIVTKRIDNGHTFQKELELHERDVFALDLKLPNEPSARGGEASPAPAAGIAGDRVEPPKESGGKGHAVAIATTAGALVLLGAGTLSFVLAGSAQDDLRTCAVSGADCTDKKQPVRTWDALALAGWASGAALGAVSIYFWLKPGRNADAASTRVDRLGLAFPGGIPSLTGRF